VKLGVTNHAVEQYVSRVKPAFDFDQARAEIVRLLQGAGPPQGPPPWTRPHGEHEGSVYIVVSDGICFATNPERTALVTCLTKGSTSAERRAAKNKKRAQRRHARHLKSKSFAAKNRGRRPEAAWD
jgi:hypothetical protein